MVRFRSPASSFNPASVTRVEDGRSWAEAAARVASPESRESAEALPEAQLLLNISNDAWFGDSLAPHQHLQMARMRARETGRYMLRATNNGISALIDEHGRTLAQLPQFAPGVLTGTARLFSGATPYVTYGNKIIVSLCLLILTIIIALTKFMPAVRDKYG